MQTIVMSQEANCARAEECFPRSSSQGHRRKWVQKHRLVLGSNGRAFALVNVSLRTLAMDAVTGTLYSIEDGKCLGSDIRPRLDFFDHEVEAEAILMEMPRGLPEG